MTFLRRRLLVPLLLASLFGCAEEPEPEPELLPVVGEYYALDSGQNENGCELPSGFDALSITKVTEEGGTHYVNLPSFYLLGYAPVKKTKVPIEDGRFSVTLAGTADFVTLDDAGEEVACPLEIVTSFEATLIDKFELEIEGSTRVEPAPTLPGTCDAVFLEAVSGYEKNVGCTTFFFNELTHYTQLWD